MTLITGIPTGVSYAVVALAVMVLLLHAAGTIRGLVSFVQGIVHPRKRPKPQSVASILG